MERPQAEWLWCEHEDCLESLEAFPTQQALHLHTQAVHTAAARPSQSSRHGGAAGHLVEAGLGCGPGPLESEPEPEPLPRLVIAPGNGCANIDKANCGLLRPPPSLPAVSQARAPEHAGR